MTEYQKIRIRELAHELDRLRARVAEVEAAELAHAELIVSQHEEIERLRGERTSEERLPGDLACGVHATDKIIHDDCLDCWRVWGAAKDRQIDRLLETLRVIRSCSGNSTAARLASEALTGHAAGGGE